MDHVEWVLNPRLLGLRIGVLPESFPPLFRKVYFAMNARKHLLALLLALPLAACSQPDQAAPREITNVKTAPDTMTEAPELTTAERMRVAQAPHPGHPGTSPDASALAPSVDAGLNFHLPDGWSGKPATPLRVVNLQAGDNPQTECYVTVLGGDGGGMAANVNRWRGQMGLEPYTDEEFAALETRELLGQNATYVDMQGSFTGMGGAGAVDDARLLGLVLLDAGQSIFVKLIGPADAVAAQQENFNHFVASLEKGSGLEAPPAETPEAAPAELAPMADFDPTKLKWSAPEGWTQAPEKMMRVVTFNTGDTECYVSVLGGDGGGIAANINRWQQQMGQEPLSADEINNLTPVTVLGQSSPLVSITGDYTNMQGELVSDYTMLGTVCLLDDQTLFVKMTGPAAEATAQHDNFVKFCESLSLEQ